MSSPSALRASRVALIVGAFAVGACGGASPTAAPTPTAALRTFAPQSSAVAQPSASPLLITLPPSSNPPATAQPGVDPSAELEIAAPYTFAPLDEGIADAFVQAMRSSMGEMADIFDLGVRSTVKKGVTTSWVIVMRFPDFGIQAKTLLDLASAGASGGASGVTVDKQKIGGRPVRIVEAQGSTISITVIGSSDLVMIIPLFGGRKEAVAVATAIIAAN